jgi:hypothetical protein
MALTTHLCRKSAAGAARARIQSHGVLALPGRDTQASRLRAAGPGCSKSIEADDLDVSTPAAVGRGSR